MAEEVKKEKGAKTKCAQTGVNLKKAKRYYRNGLYFVNVNAFKAYDKKKQEELAAAAAAPAPAPEAPAA